MAITLPPPKATMPPLAFTKYKHPHSYGGGLGSPSPIPCWKKFNWLDLAKVTTDTRCTTAFHSPLPHLLALPFFPSALTRYSLSLGGRVDKDVPSVAEHAGSLNLSTLKSSESLH